jgi:hypothetical protein
MGGGGRQEDCGRGGGVSDQRVMQIALLADIHGNLAALEAVLAELDRLRPDRIAVLGDIVDGAPDSLACWERVRGLGAVVLRGNHERYVFDYGTERAAPEWSTPQFAPVRWTVDQCRGVRAELAALPLTWSWPDVPELLLAHASARADQDSIFAHTADAALDPMFAGAEASIIVRGHNHLAGERLWGARRIVHLGAVGIPLDGHTAAQFTVLSRHAGGWRVQHHAVPYDVAATVRRFRESGYLEAGGPMARLFLREIATATHHFLPFMKRYGAAIQGGALPVEVAVERLLGEI